MEVTGEGEDFTAEAVFTVAVVFMAAVGSQAEGFTGEARASAVGDATPMAVFVTDIAVV